MKKTQKEVYLILLYNMDRISLKMLKQIKKSVDNKINEKIKTFNDCKVDNCSGICGYSYCKCED